MYYFTSLHSLFPSSTVARTGAGHGLNPGRVKHDAHWAAESLAREVGAELASHYAVGTVAAAHLSPNDTELGVRRATSQVFALLGLVHVGHALPQVKVSVFAVF